MGLTTTNYISKSLGVEMPTAYAVLKDLALNGERVKATFVIQSSRETTKTLTPIDKVEILFKWDRKTDLAKMAYEQAKTQLVTKLVDGSLVKVEGVLFGWEDAIVE